MRRISLLVFLALITAFAAMGAAIPKADLLRNGSFNSGLTGWQQLEGGGATVQTITNPDQQWDGPKVIQLLADKKRRGFETKIVIPAGTGNVLIQAAIKVENIGPNVLEDEYAASIHCTVFRANGTVDFCSASNQLKHTGTSQGWRRVEFHTGNMANANSQPTELWVGGIVSEYITGKAQFDGFRVRGAKPMTRGAVVAYFDDAEPEHLGIFNQMKARQAQLGRDFMGTFGVPATAMDNGYNLSSNQVLTIFNGGGSIGWHGWDHVPITGLNSAQMEDAFFDAIQKFASIGPDGIDIEGGAWVEGVSNAEAVQYARWYLASVRGVEPGFNYPGMTPFDVRIQEVKVGTTQAQINAWVQYAYTKKVLLILLFHKVRVNCGGNQYCTTPTILTNTFNKIAGLGLRIVPYPKAIREFAFADTVPQVQVIREVHRSKKLQSIERRY